MARVSRSFPSHIQLGQRQALAVPAAPPATPRLIQPWIQSSIEGRDQRKHVRGRVIAPRPAALAVTVAGSTVTPLPHAVVQDQSTLFWRRQQHHGSIIQNRWSGYQWVGLPAVTPLVVPHVQQLVDELAPRRRPGRVIAPPVQAAAASAPPPAQPPRPRQVVVDQAATFWRRQQHHSGVIANRWSGYQWAGLPPVLPLPKQVVQDSAALEQPRLAHRHGLVIQPGVQLAAASAIGPPPFAQPLPRQVVILGRATPRRPRGGHVVQPRTLTAPVTPPHPVVIDLCSATRRRARGGHVIIGRPLASPVTPPRPQRVIQPGQTSRRRPRGSVSRWDRQRFGTGIGPPPSTLITTPATGYVSVGDVGLIAAGATAPLPPSLFLAPSSTLTPGSDTAESPSSSGQVVAGSTATPLAGSSGIVRV